MSSERDGSVVQIRHPALASKPTPTITLTLTLTLTICQVGAATETELKDKKLRYEDALNSVRRREELLRDER